MVSRPPADTPEFWVELKPGFDQFAYASIIACRVGGKVGYIYRNLHAFTIHSFSPSAVEKISAMKEVQSIAQSTTITIN